MSPIGGQGGEPRRQSTVAYWGQLAHRVRPRRLLASTAVLACCELQDQRCATTSVSNQLPPELLPSAEWELQPSQTLEPGS